ncbi:hypothetical protein HYFRA_00013288 [Hymenoscyphus fraxineus]|uniref:DUF6590 domain-containing protein n=1 Tax=Hymenoscyphus fraxineus TaxID=746836 RepID=A0A9N9LBR1_9HELO|nr:hypothetical protein HYFRA_00013288 [Hymenoscyphus fraxineus]
MSADRLQEGLQAVRGLVAGDKIAPATGDWQTVPSSRANRQQSVSNLSRGGPSRGSTYTSLAGRGLQGNTNTIRRNALGGSQMGEARLPSRPRGLPGGSSLALGISVAGNRLPKPTERRVLSMSEYRAGMIIGAYQVDRDRDQGKGVTLANQSRTNTGTIVFEKERKFVVLRVFTTHVVVLPIYTFVGHGLESRQAEKNDYVSIREVDDGENALPAESDHPIIWSEATLEWLNSGRGWGRMSNNAVVHFTCPLRHMFTNPSQILGEVTEGCFISLRKLYVSAFSDPADFADDKEQQTQSEPTTAENPGAEQEPRSQSAPAALPSRPTPRSVAPAIPRNLPSTSTVGPTRSPPRNNGRNAPY